jgi:IS1 family transposase
MDAVSRLVISVAAGRRIQETADRMLETLKASIPWTCTILLPLILFTSDAWEQYRTGLREIFGFRHRPRRRHQTGRMRDFRQYLPWNLLYATVEKIRDGRGRVIQVIRTVVHGAPTLVEQVIRDSPVSQTIDTAFVERVNGTYRAFCSRLVRKGCGFSKNSVYHDAHIEIATAFYNFVHPHGTLSESNGRDTSPAMAAGLTDHCWSFKELCVFPVFRNLCQ